MKNSFVFNIFVFLFITLFISLGTWQLVRLDWKKNLIREIEEGLNAKPILYSYGTIKDYQRVILEGNFEYSKQIYLYSLNEKSEPGFDVLTPFILKDGNNILINRGWIKKDLKNKDFINNFKDTQVMGVVREKFKKNIFKPKNELNNNVWFTINFDEIEKYTGKKFNKFVVFLDRKDTGLVPSPRNITSDLPNNHLKYALTWYAIAISILLYFLYFKKKSWNILALEIKKLH